MAQVSNQNDTGRNTDVGSRASQCSDPLHHNFEIVERLDLIPGQREKGVFAEVYRVRDRNDPFSGTHVIKKLKERHQDNQQVVERFSLEATVLAQLDHPHIVKAIRPRPYFCNTGNVGEVNYYALRDEQLVDLMTYTHKDRPPLSYENRSNEPSRDDVVKWAHLFVSLADAIEYYWSTERCVHRDLKPDNILISQENDNIALKLCDFGTVRLNKGISRDPSNLLAGIDDQHSASSTDIRVGTFPWMAPEQVECQPVDIRTDIYGLGSTLFYMTTYRDPFTRDDDEGFFPPYKDIVNGRVPRPMQAVDKQAIPRGLQDVIMGCMAKKPEDRPDIDELRNILRSIE